MADPPPPSSTTDTSGSGSNHNDRSSSPSSSSSLLDEMTESMALSMLIFLVADLRLMSATGRIATPYETMAVDSDHHVRASAESMAVLSDDNDDTTETPPVIRGMELAPSQCMALVLIEMRHSFEHVNQSRPRRRRRRKGTRRTTAAAGAVDDDDDEINQSIHQDGSTFVNFISTVKGRHKKRVQREWQDDMHKLLKAYADMIGHDLTEKVPYIEARQSMLNLADSSSETASNDNNNNQNNKKKNPKSLGKRLDSVPEEHDIHDDDDDEQQQQDKSQENNEEHDGTDDKPKHSPLRSRLSDSNMLSPQTRQSIADRMASNRDRILLTRDERDVKHIEQVTDALFNISIQHNDVAASDETLVRPTLPNATLSGAQLLTILQKATLKRDASKLSFMGKFFREGTISKLMVKSTARFVWVNDFYPLKDLTYAIGIDREKKRVLVVFRGAITRQDWATVTQVNQTKVANPIIEDFEGRSITVSIHSGFYRYLFRVRKDTYTTKFDEICNVAHKYGAERIGHDYTVAVFGHSLGGALTTVFTFFASTDARLVANGPIKAVTFGSPYVGGHDFADSWRHQEETGRIMYARFYNHNDSVAYLPLNLTVTNRGALYRHVGVGIKIPRVPLWFTRLRKWKPRVHYAGDEGCLRAYRRALGRNVLINSPFPMQIPHMHCLAELQERMRDGKLRKEGDRGDYELLRKPIEEIYKELVGVDLQRVRQDVYR